MYLSPELLLGPNINLQLFNFAHQPREKGTKWFGRKDHIYLEPGKRGRSEKSSAIMAPIAHMSECNRE
jgi:hypothetical protein